MVHDPDWQAMHRRLEAVSTIKVAQFEIGPPITDDDRELLKVLGAAPLPKPVMNILEAANGVKLLWHGELAGRKIQGSLNILPYVQAALRAGATETSAPLEGVLWDDEFPAKARNQLKEMTVFEAIAGRPGYLVYPATDRTARLTLVENDRLQPLVPGFNTTAGLLALYAGADGLREHLVHPDWEERLSKDAALAAVAAL